MTLFNALGFNAIWFGCILYGNSFIPIALVLLVVHLYTVKNCKKELITISVTSFIGVFVDSLLTYHHVFSFSTPLIFGHIGIPLWLIAIWLGFSATINHSIKYVKGSLPIQIIIGGFVFPLSYLSGFKLNAVALGYSSVITFITVSIVWLVGLQVILYTLNAINQSKYIRGSNVL